MLSWQTSAIIMCINQKKNEVTPGIVVRIFKRFAAWSWYSLAIFKIISKLQQVTKYYKREGY